MARWLAVPLPDRVYCAARYLSVHGRLPDIDHPVRFTEKLQWRKLFDRNPLFPVFTDKIECKTYVASRVGSDWVLPTLWSGTDLRQVPWDAIPYPAVIKPSHVSGIAWLLRSRDDAAVFEAGSTGPSWLRMTHYRAGREWAYRMVRPRIMIEPACLSRGALPADYRFHMFAGRLSHIEVDFIDRGAWFYARYDGAWRRHPADVAGREDCYRGELARPRSLEAMIETARLLSSEIDYIRVDFLVAGEDCFVGELAVYPGSGFERFDDPAFDLELGAMWQLPSVG